MSADIHGMINFAVGTLVGSVVMSSVSGWWILSRRLPAKSIRGARWHLVSGSLARRDLLAIQYHLSFFLTLTDEGLRLSVFPLVRLMHPPLYIPWSAVSRVTEVSFLFFFRQTQLDILDGRFRLRLRGRAGKAILEQHELMSRYQAPLPATESA